MKCLRCELEEENQIPSHDCKKKITPWSCKVKIKRYKDGKWYAKTIFSVGNQSFILAEADYDNGDDDGLEHCRFMRKMFIKAMKFAGAPKRKSK